MPTHRARANRWPRLRTAAIALTVGAAAVAVPILPASADDPVRTSTSAGATDDVGDPVEPAAATATAREAADDGDDEGSPSATSDDAPSEDADVDEEKGDASSSSSDEDESDDDESDEDASDDEPGASRSGRGAAAEDADAADTDGGSDEGDAAAPAAAAAEGELAPAPAHGAPERVEGGDRVETSVAVAQHRFPDGESAAVLASAEDFADALAGSALAAHVDGPLLLTDQPELDERVAAELTDRLAAGSTVWLLGGPEALSDDVEGALADLGFATERLAGPDRYGTAAAIVREVVGEGAGCELIVATGTDFADGASASGYASATRPLLFTRGEKVPAATADELTRCAEGEGAVAVTAVGGSAARALGREDAGLPDDLQVTEVVGADRYATSAELLTLVRGSGEGRAQAPDAGGPVTLTSGLDYPDALIGGTYGHPVVLTEPEGLPASVAEALEGAQDNVDGVLVVGGTESVPEGVALDAVSLAADGTAAAVGGQPAAEEPAAGATATGRPTVDEAEAESDEDETAPAPAGTRTGTPTAAPSAPSATRSPAGPSSGTSSPSPTSGSASSGTATSTAGPAGPSAGAGSRSWQQAWAAHDIEVMRAWFEANVPGPRVPIRGSTPGGKIKSQSDADRLVGKEVQGSLSVDCTCTLHDFVLEDAQLTLNGGTVVVEDVLVDGKGNTEYSGLLKVRGSTKATIRRVQIKGHQDGIQTYTTGYTHGEYIYIHSHATNNPEKHHQDGIQTIGGASAFSRSFVDMRGAMVSATLIKPDAMATPYAKVNSSVMLGGGYTFHIHDGPKGTPKNVDLSGNLVGAGYKKGLMSTWELSNPGAVTTTAIVSGSGRTVTLKDAAKL